MQTVIPNTAFAPEGAAANRKAADPHASWLAEAIALRQAYDRRGSRPEAEGLRPVEELERRLLATPATTVEGVAAQIGATVDLWPALEMPERQAEGLRLAMLALHAIAAGDRRHD